MLSKARVPALVAATIGLAAALAAATPVAATDPAAIEPAPSVMLSVLPPIDFDQWVQTEAAQHLLAQGEGAGRAVVGPTEWESRPPSWIQGAALASDAALAQAERAHERAERELQTLQWVLEEQRHQAEAASRPRRDDEPQAGGEDGRWFRRLLPQHWVTLLKANREWVAAGGTTLLLIVWGASMFARRPSSAAEPRVAPHEAPAPPRRRHRHRRRHRDLQLQ